MWSGLYTLNPNVFSAVPGNATALKKVTEYAVGRLLRDRALPKHRGGLYVARSPQAPTLASCDISRYLKWLVVSNIFYFP